MYAYIDESGDLGTNGKGSRWLVFGCVMAADGNIAEVQSAVQSVRNRANPQSGKYIHFRDLSHDDKVGALNLMADIPWTGVIVASDSTTTPISDPQLFYDVTSVQVIERVLNYAGELEETANIYFESSQSLHLEVVDSLISGKYTAQWTRTGEQPETNSQNVADYQIREMRKGDAHGLDIADGLAHAAFRALEPNRKWGHFEPTYLNILTPKLWRSPSNAGLEGWGLTLTPGELSAGFRKEYPWLPS